LHGNVACGAGVFVHKHVLTDGLGHFTGNGTATISELPPGANGTTRRKGLLGQADWA